MDNGSGTGSETALGNITPPEGGQNAAPAGEGAGVPPGAEGATGDGTTPPVPEYVPSYAVKSYGKEYEIPETFRSLIKDKETEKAVREVFERAYGLDNLKGVHQNVRQENVSLKEWKESTEREIGALNEALASKDFDSVREILGISEEDLIRHAIALVERTPEQKSALQQQRRQSQELSQRDMEYQRVLQQNEQMAVRMREIELDQYLFKPEVAAIAQKYNAGKANPDAFKDLVIRVGQSHVALGKDIPVAEAVREAIGYLEGFVRIEDDPAGTPPAGNGPKVVPRNHKEALPNIAGSNKTPVKSQVTSIEDLKRIRDAMS